MHLNDPQSRDMEEYFDPSIIDEIEPDEDMDDLEPLQFRRATAHRESLDIPDFDEPFSGPNNYQTLLDAIDSL